MLAIIFKNMLYISIYFGSAHLNWYELKVNSTLLVYFYENIYITPSAHN